jgi:hypothetical protein
MMMMKLNNPSPTLCVMYALAVTVSITCFLRYRVYATPTECIQAGLTASGSLAGALTAITERVALDGSCVSTGAEASYRCKHIVQHDLGPS